MDRFLDQLEIQPDALCLNIARTPPGFHLPHAPLGQMHSNDRFPFNDQGSILLQLVSPINPIMPIPNRLLRLLIHIDTLQLHQGNTKRSGFSLNQYKHLMLTFLFRSHSHELDEFVAGLQARREKGTRKRHNPIYHQLSHKKSRLVARGETKTR